MGLLQLLMIFSRTRHGEVCFRLRRKFTKISPWSSLLHSRYGILSSTIWITLYLSTLMVSILICKIEEFIRLLKLYNEEFLNSNEMLELKSDWYDDMYPIRFWRQIGKGEYCASTSKASDLKNLAHRILYYIIARSTNGKIDSKAIVGAFDCL